MDRSNSRRRKVGQTDGMKLGTRPDGNARERSTSFSKGEPSQDSISRWKPGSAHAVCVGLTIVIFAFTGITLSGRFLNFIEDAFVINKVKVSSPESDDLGNLAIRLNPQNHVFRAPSTLKYNWEITKGFQSPDGVRKEVYLVNKHFPGETVEARSGDRVIVNVTNSLSDEGLAIHWHGLRMDGANEMDGAVGVTQNPIRPGESFLYNFVIGPEEHGTFWYHGHEKTQRDDGLYGGLVVHRPDEQANEMSKYDYDEDILLLIGDWYHRPSQEVLRWYMNSRSFGNEPVPDSLVINGKGNFDCQLAVPARPIDCTALEDRAIRPALRLVTGKRYRLRLVNTGSLTGISLRIDNSSFMPFQVDGGNEISAAIVEGVGIVYPGERADSILQTALRDDDQGLLAIEMDDENFKYPNPALNSIQAFPVKATLDSRSHRHISKPDMEYYNLQAATSKSSLFAASWLEEPLKFVIYTTTLKLAKHHYIPMGFINHTSWAPQETPPKPLISLPREQFDRNQLSPNIPLFMNDGERPESSQGWVELVINNLDDGGHPFHLHGYSFYVVSVFPHPLAWTSDKPPFTPGGSGMYNYNPFEALPRDSPAGEYNLKNPVMKDTVFVPQRGYTVIRFKADNKGIWMMHCHVGWHLGSGMAMSWDVR
ncbi:hypothetical protein DV736_g6142, partial [Chaetothyriales sp. CBS 134916]